VTFLRTNDEITSSAVMGTQGGYFAVRSVERSSWDVLTFFSLGGAVTSIDGGPFVDLGRVRLLELDPTLESIFFNADELLLGLGFVALFDIGWFGAVGVARIWSDCCYR